VGALDQLREATGDGGIVGRARSNPRWLIAIAVAAILVLAWIAWTIYVTSDKGARAGLGVLIAWPAMVAALILVSLPFIGGYLLIRYLSEGSGETASVQAGAEAGNEDPG
jgi:hypothetical protein